MGDIINKAIITMLALIIGCAFCVMSICVYCAVDISISPKQTSDITIEQKWKVEQKIYFSDSNDNQYQMTGKKRHLRYEKIEINNNYTIQFLEPHISLSDFLSYSEVMK